MLTRLMDLVVLVAELSQEASHGSGRELDEELIMRGYSPEEIEQAVFWFSSRTDSAAGESLPLSARGAVRVLSDWERWSLSTDCYGYLLRLLNLGIIDTEQFEKIIARSIPVGQEKIPLGEVKAIACSIVFNREARELDEDIYEGFDEDLPTT